MTITISFPHPPKQLSPNGKVPLLARAAAKLNAMKINLKKTTRDGAYLRAISALNHVPQRNFPAKQVEVIWYYKRGVPPDVDNVVARLKPLLDGCAEAFGINDRDFEAISVRRVHTKSGLAGTLDLTFDTEPLLPTDDANDDFLS